MKSEKKIAACEAALKFLAAIESVDTEANDDCDEFIRDIFDAVEDWDSGSIYELLKNIKNDTGTNKETSATNEAKPEDNETKGNESSRITYSHRKFIDDFVEQVTAMQPDYKKPEDFEYKFQDMVRAIDAIPRNGFLLVKTRDGNIFRITKPKSEDMYGIIIELFDPWARMDPRNALPPDKAPDCDFAWKGENFGFFATEGMALYVEKTIGEYTLYHA